MKKIKNVPSYYLIFIIVISLLNLFVLNIRSKILLLPFFVVILIMALFIFKYRKDNFYAKTSMMATMTLFGVCQMILYFITGVKEGFSNNAISLSFNSLYKIIFPLILITIIIEIIRYLISRKFSENKYTYVLSLIMFVLIDVMLYSSSASIRVLDNFLELVGIVIFPSIVSNVILGKIVMQYGYKPNILYKLVTTLPFYVVPIVPNLYILFRAIGRIVAPLLLYLIISYMYDKISFENIIVRKKGFSIAAAFLAVIVIILAALISCKFEYGVLTVGSGSMTGTLDIGDVAFFQQYKDQDLQIGDIIIFSKGRRSIIHRVVEIGVFNEEPVYVTKGDKNNDEDPGYVYKKNILGVVRKKISYMGYPSIWIKSIFSQ